MPKWNQGYFEPKNPAKYIGTKPIRYRSAWELAFMNVCDNHPNIMQWASESIKIPYVNPFTGKATVYIPDFLVIYIDKYGKRHGEVVEIKPSRQTTLERARTRNDKFAVALNMVKWKAAQAWASRNGLTFRVMTEEHLFANSRSVPKPRRKARR